MRKWLCLALLFLPLKVHAFITDPVVVQEKSGSIHLSTGIAANIPLSVFTLVKLASPTVNSTVNFPHREATGELDVTEIRVSIDKAAASTCTVRIGVVNFVNQSTGSVTFFWDNNSALNVSNTTNLDTVNHTEGFTRCRVIPASTFNTDGLTPFIASNEKRSGSSLYSAATAQFSPMGSAATLTGTGDIVAEIINGAGAINVTIDLIYHSEP